MAGQGSGRRVRVWDPAVRLFHWSLVAAVGVCLLLEAGERWHFLAGYVVLGLVGFRLVWGVVGSRHARFTNFVVGPRAIGDYLARMVSGHAPRHLGHNPAGGAMIVLLLAVLLLSAVSGALLDTDALWGTEWLEDAHEAISSAFYVLVPLHVLGAVVSSLLHRENLIRAMVTGDKEE